MEIYVLGGGMLQRIKLIQKTSEIYSSFLCGVRERDYNFASNQLLYIYPEDVRVDLPPGSFWW